MTTIGKILTFLNLIAALGFVTYGATVYAQRPGWFDPIPDVVDKGQSPQNFLMLKQETENLGRTANAVSAAWGAELKKLQAAETRHADRRAEWKRRAEWIRKGNPNPPDAKDVQPGFFLPVYETDAFGKETTNLDHTRLGASVKLNGVALRGAETLKEDYDRDVLALAELEKQIMARRKEYDALGTAILAEEGRLLKMSDIRAAVQAELFFLETFEVNVYETRETVFRRQRQLDLRLRELGGGGN